MYKTCTVFSIFAIHVLTALVLPISRAEDNPPLAGGLLD